MGFLGGRQWFSANPLGIDLDFLRTLAIRLSIINLREVLLVNSITPLGSFTLWIAVAVCGRLPFV